MEDNYGIESTLQQFIQDAPNAYSQDEYEIASQINNVIGKQEFEELVKICKKPIFSFLETELVKLIKRFAANPPQQKIVVKKADPTVKIEDIR